MKEETNHPVLLTAWTFSLEYCRAGGEKGERKRGGGKGEREGERGREKEKEREREKHTITSSTYDTKRQGLGK